MITGSLDVPAAFERRRAASETRYALLRSLLPVIGLDDERHPQLAIYATGSLGRRELGTHSDLDVFLVDTAVEGQRVGNLDRIRLLSDLMRATEAAGFPKFSNDGEFLIVHPLAELRDFLGTRDDDARNVFTARMLLLLESVPLVGNTAYQTCIERVLEDYWRDARTDGFLPVFLINDIVRYWKTLCLNYEARRPDLAKPDDPSSIARRRLALAKLRFNRLWMCFNGLAYLVAGYQPGDGTDEGQIAKEHAASLVTLSPLQRMTRIVGLVPEAADPAQRALDEFGWWLEVSDADKELLTEAFAEDAMNDEARARGERFGNAMGEMVDVVGARTRLHRYLLL